MSEGEPAPIDPQLARDYTRPELFNFSEVSLSELPAHLVETDSDGLNINENWKSKIRFAYKGVELDLAVDKTWQKAGNGLTAGYFVLEISDVAQSLVIKGNLSVTMTRQEGLYFCSTDIEKELTYRDTPMYRGLGLDLYKKMLRLIGDIAKQFNIKIDHVIVRSHEDKLDNEKWHYFFGPILRDGGYRGLGGEDRYWSKRYEPEKKIT